MKLRLDYEPSNDKLDFYMTESSDGIYAEKASKTLLIASCEAENWSEEYSKTNSMLPISIMPAAIRYLSPDRRIIVWERPPTYKTINYTNDYQANIQANNASKNEYRIAVPWQVYIAYLSPQGRLANVFAFFRKTQLTSLIGEPLGFPILPNFYDNAKLCQAAFDTVQDYDRDLFAAMDAAYSMIWNSGFNKDTLAAFNMIFAGHVNNDQNPLCPKKPWGANATFPTVVFNKWQNYSLAQVLNFSWPACCTDVISFLSSGHLQHGTEDDKHSFLVGMMFAAQDAV